MSVVSPRRLRSGKIINNYCTLGNSSKNHPNMDSDLNIAVNADSDSNSSESHQNGINSNSQAEMNEIKGLLSTLTQQFTSRLKEGNALRASSSRNPERMDRGPFGDIKKQWKIFLKKFSKKKRKMTILEQSHSAEKLEKGDYLGFLKLQFAANYQNKLEGGPFGDKKKSKKVAQCQKHSKGGPCSPFRFCILR